MHASIIGPFGNRQGFIFIIYNTFKISVGTTGKAADEEFAVGSYTARELGRGAPSLAAARTAAPLRVRAATAPGGAGGPGVLGGPGRRLLGSAQRGARGDPRGLYSASAPRGDGGAGSSGAASGRAPPALTRVPPRGTPAGF